MASPSSSCCCLGLLLLLVLALAHVQAFAFAPALLPGGGVRGAAAAAAGSRSAVSGLRMGYVPDGMTKEQYAALRAKEEAAKPKNLGRVGTNRFKSRSFAAWHAAGGKHLFPVDPRKVKTGEVALKDVPYMQRGGAWDDSDLKGKSAKKQAWTALDKEYANGGERLAQSVSIFGGANLPWNAKFKPMKANAMDPRKVQAQVKRPETNLAPNKKALERREKELARMEKELKSEKKGWFNF